MDDCNPLSVIDGGSFEVYYDLPLENAYAVLPILKRPSPDPPLLEVRASTALERTDSLNVIPANRHAHHRLGPSKPSVDMVKLRVDPVRPSLDSISAALKAKPQHERVKVVSQHYTTELRRVQIYGFKQNVVSYVYHSQTRPMVSSLNPPKEWRSVVKDREGALLFLIWQTAENTCVWLYDELVPSVACHWRVIEVGVAFGRERNMWRKKVDGTHILVLRDNVASLVLKETEQKYRRQAAQDSP
ncbi:hypothetical protein BDZ89DRAFT_1139232 [Hymenopellis radicata]|nr:hypothetical protein BDZ89DRAFT_1139232 [Hymenopellis radicata]